MIQAVIFDLDGVIANSEPYHGISEKLVFKELGIKPVEIEAGTRFADVISKISSRNGLNLNVKEVVDKKFDIMIDMFKSQLNPIEHSIELINKIAGKKLAVVSSSTKNWVNFSLRKFGVDKKFDVIIAAEDIKNGKPNPEPYLTAARKLNLKPENCMVIEDSSKGVESAKSAGMVCIGLISPHTVPEDLSKADYVLNDIIKVEDFLQ